MIKKKKAPIKDLSWQPDQQQLAKAVSMITDVVAKKDIPEPHKKTLAGTIQIITGVILNNKKDY